LIETAREDEPPGTGGVPLIDKGGRFRRGIWTCYDCSQEAIIMELKVSPKTQARIAELVERLNYPDANALIEHALDLHEEQNEALRAELAIGDDDFESGRFAEFTPELSDQIWQQAIDLASKRSQTASHVGE
jgi:predicted transcriptional regulator